MFKELSTQCSKLILSLSACLALAACGGGGGGTPPISFSSSSATSAATSSSISSVQVVCSSDCDNKIRINEAMASNSVFEDEDGDDEDWLELYNYGASNISLEGWTLSDSVDEPGKWAFPDFVLVPGQYLQVWASNKDRYNVSLGQFHTNFKISSSGETLFLFDQNGNEIDVLLVEGVAAGQSIGMSASETLVLYNAPTPGAENSADEFLGTTASIVTFSHEGGYFNEASVILSGAADQEVIRYTLDATIPTVSAPIYNEPIGVINNTVIRARVFQDNYIPSRTATRTYLTDTAHDLPVITLVTAPDNFFNNDTGIYEYGDNYSNEDPHYGANFWEDWEREIHFSFYEKNGSFGVAIDAGIKIFGGWSRAHDQRSFSIFARNKYGFKELKYPLFPALDYDEFQAIVLRNSGNDWHRTMLKDAALTTLMAGSGVETQAYQPVAVYLNKNYWGLYNLREKINEHFLASRFNIDADDVDLLERDSELIEGDDSEYIALIDYVENNDLSIADNYEYVASQVDINNYIAYQAAQIYFNNQDWPGNNIKFWKSPNTKWRWVLFDTEFGMGLYNDTDYTQNALARALATNGPDWPNPAWSTLLFRRLVESSVFRNKFINHLSDELNTRFLPENVTSHIDNLAANIASEIPLYQNRWSGWPTDWTGEISNFKESARNRPEYVRSHIQSQFGLEAVHNLTISNAQSARGSINVNSLNIKSGSWSGKYFEGVPVKLKAMPAEGFVFSHWEGGSTATEPEIDVELIKSVAFLPKFIPE